ncbi:MAG TPA: MBL fold metallo-hydrolase, partial [Nannocystis exedens]|nr:MBL fold metallo-hydrolase [Nannocystis exedens]
MPSLGPLSFVSALLLTCLAVVVPACVLNPYSVTVTKASSSTHTIEASLGEPGPIAHEVVISGYWSAKRRGLINLRHPRAKAAGLKNDEMPIVLPVHVLRHPEHGLFVIDTGVTQARVDGEPDAAKGLFKSVLKGLMAERSLASIVEASGGDLRGVLLTHMHFDHVLGLGDVPVSVPVYTGPGESAAKRFGNGLLRATYRELLSDRDIREWTFAAATAEDPLAAAIDFFGDGSLWVLPCPGHTPGSVAYLVRSTAGPLLIVGDTSHTHWGFEHSVEPGTFTDDH